MGHSCRPLKGTKFQFFLRAPRGLRDATEKKQNLIYKTKFASPGGKERFVAQGKKR